MALLSDRYLETRGDAIGGGALGAVPPILEPGAPSNEKVAAVEKLADSGSLLAIKVVIVNCNGTVVVVFFCAVSMNITFY